MIRFIYFYFHYLLRKILDLNTVKYNGFTIIYSTKKKGITINKGTVINSGTLSNLLGLYQRTIIIVKGNGKIIIGNDCGISGSTIYSVEEIIIGAYTRIGANCKIIDTDFHPIELEYRHKGQNQYAKKKPIIIGNDCFIGMNSFILKGTVLGNNVVVGAGSVVSGVFPDNVLIAGNPARILKELTS